MMYSSYASTDWMGNRRQSQKKKKRSKNRLDTLTSNYKSALSKKKSSKKRNLRKSISVATLQREVWDPPTHRRDASPLVSLFGQRATSNHASSGNSSNRDKKRTNVSHNHHHGTADTGHRYDGNSTSTAAMLTARGSITARSRSYKHSSSASNLSRASLTPSPYSARLSKKGPSRRKKEKRKSKKKSKKVPGNISADTQYPDTFSYDGGHDNENYPFRRHGDARRQKMQRPQSATPRERLTDSSHAHKYALTYSPQNTHGRPLAVVMHAHAHTHKRDQLRSVRHNFDPYNRLHDDSEVSEGEGSEATEDREEKAMNETNSDDSYHSGRDGDGDDDGDGDGDGDGGSGNDSNIETCTKRKFTMFGADASLSLQAVALPTPSVTPPATFLTSVSTALISSGTRSETDAEVGAYAHAYGYAHAHTHEHELEQEHKDEHRGYNSCDSNSESRAFVERRGSWSKQGEAGAARGKIIVGDGHGRELMLIDYQEGKEDEQDEAGAELDDVRYSRHGQGHRHRHRRDLELDLDRSLQRSTSIAHMVRGLEQELGAARVEIAALQKKVKTSELTALRAVEVSEDFRQKLESRNRLEEKAQSEKESEQRNSVHSQQVMAERAERNDWQLNQFRDMLKKEREQNKYLSSQINAMQVTIDKIRSTNGGSTGNDSSSSSIGSTLGMGRVDHNDHNDDSEGNTDSIDRGGVTETERKATAELRALLNNKDAQLQQQQKSIAQLREHNDKLVMVDLAHKELQGGLQVAKQEKTQLEVQLKEKGEQLEQRDAELKALQEIDAQLKEHSLKLINADLVNKELQDELGRSDQDKRKCEEKLAALMKKHENLSTLVGEYERKEEEKSAEIKALEVKDRNIVKILERTKLKLEQEQKEKKEIEATLAALQSTVKENDRAEAERAKKNDGEQKRKQSMMKKKQGKEEKIQEDPQTTAEELSATKQTSEDKILRKKIISARFKNRRELSKKLRECTVCHRSGGAGNALVECVECDVYYCDGPNNCFENAHTLNRLRHRKKQHKRIHGASEEETKTPIASTAVKAQSPTQTQTSPPPQPKGSSLPPSSLKIRKKFAEAGAAAEWASISASTSPSVSLRQKASKLKARSHLDLFATQVKARVRLSVAQNKRMRHSHHLRDVHLPLCDICEHTRAGVFCKQCQKCFCVGDGGCDAEAHATTRGSSHQREALVVTSFLLERIMSGEKHYRASERIKTRKASRPNMHRQHATVTLSCAGLSALHDDGECQALVSMFVDERRAEKYGFEFIGQTELSELHRNPAFKKKLELELTSGEELKFEVFDVDHMPETSDDLCFTLSLDTDEIYHRLFSHAGKREDAANAREEKESVLTLACALPSISSVSPSPPSSSSITLQCPLVPSKKFLQYHPNHGTLFPHLVLKFDFA